MSISWPNFRRILDSKLLAPRAQGLYRSATPDLVTKATMLDYLDKHQIEIVIDLRPADDHGANTAVLSNSHDNLEYFNVPISNGEKIFTEDIITEITVKATNDQQCRDLYVQKYIEYYMHILDIHTKDIVNIFQTIENNLLDKNILVFCYAGKDRTGIISWLLQELAGLEHDNIIDSYVKSEQHLFDNFSNNQEMEFCTKADLWKVVADPEILQTVKNSVSADTYMTDRLNNNFLTLQNLLRNKIAK